MSNGKPLPYAYQFEVEDPKKVNPDKVNPGLARVVDSNGGSAAINDLKSGLIVIGGELGKRTHWMLGVGTDKDTHGNDQIIADDPFTGAKFKIDTVGKHAGHVTEIFKDGAFRPLDPNNKAENFLLQSFDGSGSNRGYAPWL